MQVRMCLSLLSALMLCASASSQQAQTYEWSSDRCENCESTILYPNWYADGSGLIAEGISSSTTNIVVAVTAMGGNLVVALGFERNESPLTIYPRQAITLETDSAPHMVLYALERPGPGLHKDDLAMKKQFKAITLSLSTHVPVAGFLFFPVDPEASHITVVASLGDETFRFPFARDPNARARFIDPRKVAGPSSHQAEAASTPEASALPSSRRVENSMHQDGDAPSQQQSAVKLASGQDGKTRACEKNISFAVLENGQVESRAPKFTQKWIDKNQKKYPSLCFSQTPDRQAVNYLLVFSTSRSAFNGIYPTVRTNTSSSTTPVNGSGTITDNYGGMWNYTYNGTVTTTTTTTSQVNLPYTDTARSLFLYGYDQHGVLVSQHERTVTSRQGGDSANTLGYNLGAMLGAIHIKERLLQDAIRDIVR